jgi:archaellum component FlaC
MKKKTKFISAFAVAVWALPATGEDSIQKTRSVLNQWVETKQILSEEKSDWRLEKSILQDTQVLLSKELTRMNEAIDDLEASATAADADRAALTVEKDKQTAAAAVVKSNIGALETKVKTIIKTLPEPLVDKIKPLIRRLPNDSNNTKLSLGERVQNVVGILSQADKFNSTITLSNESLEIAEGKVVQVTTLYWGLAQAYFVDNAGSYAGVGKPGAEAWEWTEIEGVGPQIKQLLDIYEGIEEIQFVEIPASIQ